jgi:hypothetical protein
MTIVSSHEKDDDVDVVMRQEGGVTTKLIVIASEPMSGVRRRKGG